MMNEDINQKLEELERWFKENPKLPTEIDRLLLRRFLKCMFNDVEETKKLIELNFTLRNKHSHIFLTRDPHDENVQKVRAATDLVPLPGLTEEGHKLLFYRLADYDASKMNSVEECKIFFMMADCRFIMPDVEDHDEKLEQEENDANENNTDKHEEHKEHLIASGEVQIVDIAGYSMSHIARISFMTLRLYMKFLQEAYPVRLRAMHIINCPPFLNKMIAIVKPFIHDEVYKMIHFHTESIDTLYEHVPRDMLPNEYGGKAGTVAELKEKWAQHLIEKRDYLMDPKHWKIDEPTENRSRWFWF